MAKVRYKDILTVHVPYLPNFGEDIQPPSYFEKTVKSFGENMPDIKDFELHEIEGTRLVYFPEDDGWIDLGHTAIYKRVRNFQRSKPNQDKRGA